MDDTPATAPVVTRSFAVLLAVATGACGLALGLLAALGYAALTDDHTTVSTVASESSGDAQACTAVVLLTTRMDGQPSVAMRAGSFSPEEATHWRSAADLLDRRLLAGTSGRVRTPVARLAAQYHATDALVSSLSPGTSYDSNAVGRQLARTAAAEKSARSACAPSLAP